MPATDFNTNYLTPLLEKLNREDKICFNRRFLYQFNENIQ